MKLPQVPFVFTDWSQIEAREYPGESGTSFWWTFEKQDGKLVPLAPDQTSA